MPFGTPITQRPPIPSAGESEAAYNAKRHDKKERRSLRRAAAQGSESAIAKLEAMEVEAGQGVKAGKGEKGAKKAGLMGNKGQKLPKGVLPGGIAFANACKDQPQHASNAPIPSGRS